MKELPGSRPTSHDATDGRRLEVLADGVSLHGGSSRSTPPWSVLCDVTEPQATRVPGTALDDARRQEERTYPELAGEGGRARLVDLAVEVDGKWSAEARDFLGALSKDKARSAPLALQSSATTAWFRLWSAILVCSAGLLTERRSAPAADGALPALHDVVSESRCALARVSFSFFVSLRFFTFGQVKGNARYGRSQHRPTKIFES